MLPENNEIEGVIFKPLVSHGDDRGFFREIVRITDPFFGQGAFGQWSHSKMQKGVVKAWHFHHKQIDWWYVPFGKIQTILFDNREESPTFQKKLTFFMGDSFAHGEDVHEVCVKIPQGVLHGCEVLSDSAHLFYITSEIYNPEDEGRFPFDSDVVGHKWECKEPITSAQDRTTFIPPHQRIKS